MGTAKVIAKEGANQESSESGSSAKPSLEDLVKEGFGIEINKQEGTRYEGHFKDDLKDGHGKLLYELTGDCYEGEWSRDNIHGDGKFSFSNGDVFLGKFRDNQMFQGILQKVNGDEYAGDFKDDLYDGYSLYKYAVGDSYCGDFVLGKRHGNGVLKIAATGENFAGRFENDELIGGQVLCQEGEYMGEFAPKTRAF